MLSSTGRDCPHVSWVPHAQEQSMERLSLHAVAPLVNKRHRTTAVQADAHKTATTQRFEAYPTDSRVLDHMSTVCRAPVQKPLDILAVAHADLRRIFHRIERLLENRAHRVGLVVPRYQHRGVMRGHEHAR